MIEQPLTLILRICSFCSFFGSKLTEKCWEWPCILSSCLKGKHLYSCCSMPSYLFFKSLSSNKVNTIVFDSKKNKFGEHISIFLMQADLDDRFLCPINPRMQLSCKIYQDLCQMNFQRKWTSTKGNSFLEWSTWSH